MRRDIWNAEGASYSVSLDPGAPSVVHIIAGCELCWFGPREFGNSRPFRRFFELMAYRWRVLTSSCVSKRQALRQQLVCRKKKPHCIPHTHSYNVVVVLRVREKIFACYVINYVKINFNLTGLTEKYRFATLIQSIQLYTELVICTSLSNAESFLIFWHLNNIYVCAYVIYVFFLIIS